MKAITKKNNKVKKRSDTTQPAFKEDDLVYWESGEGGVGTIEKILNKTAIIRIEETYWPDDGTDKQSSIISYKKIRLVNLKLAT